MKKTITREEYKKVVLENVEIDIPEETLYFWHNGERVAYSVKPEWTTWNVQHRQKPEEIWKLHIVKVDPDMFGGTVSRHTVRVSDISDILASGKHSFYRLMNNLLFHPEEERRTKEEFMKDYNQVIDAISEAM